MIIAMKRRGQGVIAASYCDPLLRALAPPVGRRPCRPAAAQPSRHERFLFAKLVAMRPGFWTLTGRPLWRDWVFGVLLIVIPWSIDPRARSALIAAYAFMAAGCAVLVAAFVHFSWRVIHRRG